MLGEKAARSLDPRDAVGWDLEAVFPFEVHQSQNARSQGRNRERDSQYARLGGVLHDPSALPNAASIEVPAHQMPNHLRGTFRSCINYGYNSLWKIITSSTIQIQPECPAFTEIYRPMTFFPASSFCPGICNKKGALDV
jgi:hypothetical protein